MAATKRKHFVQALMLSALLHSVTGTGCSKKITSIPVESAPLVLPNNIGPILVLVDHLPGNDAFVEARAEQVAIGLRYFSERTSWQYIDAAPLQKVQSAAAVVYLGLNGNTPPSPDALARLRRAHHLVVSRYHLATLREAGIAFQHSEAGNDIQAPAGTTVRYKDQSFPCPLPDFLNFKIEAPARLVADYVLPDKTSLPYIVQDGDALFVNGEISFDSGEAAWRGAMLTVCDAIAQFIAAQPLPGRPQAMLRLEDVSALTPYRQLDSIVQYLEATRVPYGMGVIPDLRLKGKTVRPLADNHELLDILRRAEQHGATTVLHGLHLVRQCRGLRVLGRGSQRSALV